MTSSYLNALPERLRIAVGAGVCEDTEEIRMRAGQPILLRGRGGRAVALDCAPSQEECERMLERMCAHSVFAYEEELKECYITLRDGSRVGFCGRMMRGGAQPHSFNIRLAKEVYGAGDGMVKLVTAGGLHSALIVSVPGAGKTTVLRDTARQLSNMGWQVCLADERGELSAPVQGVPMLDVGRNTDVMSGCPKATAMTLMIRAMAPEILITDELATAQDAAAVMEAAGSGVKVIASAHAGSSRELRRRESLLRPIEEGVFERVALLGQEDGIRSIRDITGEVLCV